MANTVVEFTGYASQSLVAYLSPRSGATGTPAASYPVTESDAGQYRFTVPESLVGEFDLKVLAGADLAARAYVTLANDALIHIAYEHSLANEFGSAIKAGVDAVIKSGEPMTVTSSYDTPRTITMTRN